MENGTLFSRVPFWMVIFAVGAEFVWIFFSPGVGCLNISQPLAVFAIDWLVEISSLFRQVMGKIFCNSRMSFVSDSVGEEFCQQMASRICGSECRVICSVVPVMPDAVV